MGLGMSINGQHCTLLGYTTSGLDTLDSRLFTYRTCKNQSRAVSEVFTQKIIQSRTHSHVL